MLVPVPTVEGVAEEEGLEDLPLASCGVACNGWRWRGRSRETGGKGDVERVESDFPR